TATGNGFPTGTAQRRTVLLNAVAQAAKEGVIGWLPADLLWLYTPHGIQARQGLNITVTRAGVIRDFTKSRISGPKVQPFIRTLRKHNFHWQPSTGGQISMGFLVGTEKSLPYLLLGPTAVTRTDYRYRYEDSEALLGYLADDCVLKALAPDAHLVLMMFTDNGIPTDDSRELAWNAAAEHGRTVDFSTLNSRLSYLYLHGRWFGLEVPADAESWTAKQLKEHWDNVTPQQADEAGYGLVRELLEEAVQNDPALLARVRRSLARWTGETATETETRALTMERLDRLAERMLPQHVQDAFDGIFPTDADRRRQVLLSAAVRAAEEGVSAWLPVSLIWLYTSEGTEARKELNVTVTQFGIVRNFSTRKVKALHPGIRTLRKDRTIWVPVKGSDAADLDFLFGMDGALPYLLHAPIRATDGRYPFQYGDLNEFLDLLEGDRVLRALAPDAHLVPLMRADKNASGYGVREVAWNAAAAHGRVVDFSTANSRLSKEVMGARSLGLEVADGESWSKERILQHWKVVTAEDAERAGDGLVPALLG
ncbi:hypothetical protein ACIP10_37255, partial [Streptomyces galbus]|uniref:hypothetical protein n=1 Tax=Streptomyces galbus TaxID=33898 RepID=UPI003825DC04